jgi:uncharacterized membrane protein YfcA
LEPISWLIAAVCLLAGCTIQTALGFGMAVIGAPILILVNPLWVPVPITLVALVLSIFNTWNQRQDLELEQLKLPFITRIPGTIFGAWLLSNLNVFWLQIFVSTCVLFAVAVSLLHKQFDYTPTRMGIAAFVSGIMGTTTSIGGPPMALVMQHGKSASVRANLSLFFAYSCSISMISYYMIGILNAELIWTSISFVPTAVLGFFAGVKLRPYVDAGRFRPLLLLLCGVAGLIALIGALI